jgi:hypothetical protein
MLQLNILPKLQKKIDSSQLRETKLLQKFFLLHIILFTKKNSHPKIRYCTYEWAAYQG